MGKAKPDIAIRGASPVDNALIGRKIADAPWAIYARKSYVRRFGGVDKPEDINRHMVNIFNGALGDHHSVQWIRSVAPDARIVARADNLAGLLMAAKSGSGLTPMPVIVGDSESGLVRVLGPVPELAAPFYLLMHRDMKGTPRVRALFEFFAEELPAIRALLIGKTGPKSKLAKQSR